jgi:hypothetical protein
VGSKDYRVVGGSVGKQATIYVDLSVSSSKLEYDTCVDSRSICSTDGNVIRNPVRITGQVKVDIRRPCADRDGLSVDAVLLKHHVVKDRVFIGVNENRVTDGRFVRIRGGVISILACIGNNYVV